MKIVSYSDDQTCVVGKCCDRCGHRVQFQNRQLTESPTAVSLGAELARFLSIDIDEGHLLQRADLCESCASKLLDCVRPFLPAFRTIASDDPARGHRIYSYRVLDANTGRHFQVSSLVDDGA